MSGRQCCGGCSSSGMASGVCSCMHVCVFVQSCIPLPVCFRAYFPTRVVRQHQAPDRPAILFLHTQHLRPRVCRMVPLCHGRRVAIPLRCRSAMPLVAALPLPHVSFECCAHSLTVPSGHAWEKVKLMVRVVPLGTHLLYSTSTCSHW